MALEQHTDAVMKVYYTEADALAGGTTNMLEMDTATGEVSRTSNPGSADKDFNFFIYREYWYRFEFNEPVNELYVDWDDGEDNDPKSKANYQHVKFDVPKFFGIASHIYTKNSKFFPLIRAKSTTGYWSKYYTSDHADNNYLSLETATLSGGQNDFSMVSEVGVDSNSKKLMPYLVPHNLPPTAILKTDRKRIFAGINNDLITTATNENIISCYCDNTGKNASGSEITLDIVYQDNSAKIKNTQISTYVNRLVSAGGTGITVKKILSVKLTNLKEVTTSTGSQLKSGERVYVTRNSDSAVIAAVSLGNPYITYDGVGYSALLDASESITKASNVDIKSTGTGGYYWDLGDFSFGSPNVVSQAEQTGTHCKNISDELPASTVSTNSQKRVRYTPDLITTTAKRSYKDSFGRFFTEEKLCRIQVEDNHTDNTSDTLFQEDTFGKSSIESFRKDTYTLEKYVPLDYVNEGLILAYYDDAETSSWSSIAWADKSTTLTDATSVLTLGTSSSDTITNGPHQHILLVKERKFNKIFIGVKNVNTALTHHIRINLKYVAEEGGKRVWKPLAFVDNTSIGDDLSLRKNGSLVFDMPEDWVTAQGDADSSAIWEDNTWDSAPPRANDTSVDPDTLWDFDGYGLMMDISVFGADFADTGNIVQIIPFDNAHSQIVEVEDPHHISLSNVSIAQSISWKRKGKYYNIQDRLGRAEIRKIGVEGAGSLKLGGIELDDSGVSGTASYKLMQNYQEKSVPVFIDVERQGGEFIRFFGKITDMSEDSPTGKMIPKWAVELAVSHIIEFNSSGTWVSDTPVGLGGYIEDEPRYIPTTVQL